MVHLDPVCKVFLSRTHSIPAQRSVTLCNTCLCSSLTRTCSTSLVSNTGMGALLGSSSSSLTNSKLPSISPDTVLHLAPGKGAAFLMSFSGFLPSILWAASIITRYNALCFCFNVNITLSPGLFLKLSKDAHFVIFSRKIVFTSPCYLQMASLDLWRPGGGPARNQG